MAGELFFHILRKSKWIYISSEFYNIFLFEVVNLAYFFDITSVKTILVVDI